MSQAIDLPRTVTREQKIRRVQWAVIVVWIGAILWLFPLAGALVTSLRSQEDISANGFWSIPQTLSLNNYQEAWGQAGISNYLGNSFIITLPALFGMLFLSSMSAYALIRFRFRLSRFFYFMFLAGMLLPFQILMLPVFRLSNQLGVYDTYWALILFHTAFQLGFCTFVLRNFMRTIPVSLFESAVIDGAGEFTIYRRIGLPLVVPALAALATLEFTWVFNDYLWALVLVSRNELKPVTTGLSTLFGQYINNWPLIVSGSLLATVPTLIVFFALQRYFIGGLTMGATKG
ncbi:MAG: carbohydrate ABC transporter permease [Trueperaceae bacterium]|nr:MAG: carbohydrate ABC transporter permease [Trueperaceae bacterium]